MPHSRGRDRTLLLDANVLIDLCEADRTVIRLISDHVGKVRVPLPVLREEVDQLDENEYAGLGIVPVEPPLSTVVEAATRRSGLLTNDGRLRRQCAAEKVPVMWGLETVALLVDGGVLAARAAEEIGRAIQRANPMFITERVIARFLERIEPGAASREKSRRQPPSGET